MSSGNSKPSKFNVTGWNNKSTIFGGQMVGDENTINFTPDKNQPCISSKSSNKPSNQASNKPSNQQTSTKAPSIQCSNNDQIGQELINMGFDITEQVFNLIEQGKSKQEIINIILENSDNNNNNSPQDTTNNNNNNNNDLQSASVAPIPIPANNNNNNNNNNNMDTLVIDQYLETRSPALSPEMPAINPNGIRRFVAAVQSANLNGNDWDDY
eukprot:165271_1